MIYQLWASYQIRNIAGCACAGNAEKVFPRRRFQRKPLVNDPGMHHGTCVTHVPWCMSGSLTYSDGENVPGIPRACAPAILRIWKEAHNVIYLSRAVCHVLLAATNHNVISGATALLSGGCLGCGEQNIRINIYYVIYQNARYYMTESVNHVI